MMELRNGRNILRRGMTEYPKTRNASLFETKKIAINLENYLCIPLGRAFITYRVQCKQAKWKVA